MRHHSGRFGRGACASGTPAANRDPKSPFTGGCMRGYPHGGRSDGTHENRRMLLSLNLKAASRKWNDPLPVSIVRASFVSNGSILRMLQATGYPKWWSALAESMFLGSWKTILSRGLGNCARGAARGGRHHAMRLQLGNGGGAGFANCHCRMDGTVCRPCRRPRVYRRGLRLLLAAWTSPGGGHGSSRQRNSLRKTESRATVRIGCAPRPHGRRPLIVSNELLVRK